MAQSPSTRGVDAGRLPTFPGGELPAPESPARVFTNRAIGVVALLATAAYLLWRTLATVDLSVWWLSVPLLVLEVHAAISLALFVFSTWDIGSVPPVAPVSHTTQRVAVLIPTYNESTEVLLPTVAAAVALAPNHETWVLDDGNRPAVRDLAHNLGARYLTRTDHRHAKAGNINHALQVIEADLVAVLDADHVAMPGFLVNTLGYFDDPSVAVVQTPQDFYNVESFEHEAQRGWLNRRQQGQRFNEQALFYRVLQAGKNRWAAAFWCGTGAVVRTSALREIGGVATETITEDIHTTIRLHRRGWRSIYHNEVLARGLAAADPDQYASQRTRWGAGAMQVLRTENPLTVPGLRLRQRLAYAATLLGWFEAWRTLGYLLLPPAALLTGAVPIRADLPTFLVAFGATLGLQRLALQLLGRGRAPALLSTVFEMVRMPANLLATLTIVRPGTKPFSVTPKGRMGEARRRHRSPLLLRAVMGVSLFAGLWFVATIAGLTPLHYGVRWAAIGAAVWLVVNTSLVGLAIGRVRHRRFASERRAAVRFDVDIDAKWASRPVLVSDLSLTGAKIDVLTAAAWEEATASRLSIVLDGAKFEIDTEVRSVWPGRSAGEVTVGLAFRDPTPELEAQFALALFHRADVPALALSQPGTVAA